MGIVLALVVTLAGISGLYGQTAPRYLVTVREVKTTSSPDNGAPGMKEDVFFVKFQAILRNTSDRTIWISAEPLIIAKGEILLPSGAWKTMFTSSSYETKGQTYLQCTRVEPDKTFTLPNVSDIVVLPRDRPSNQTVNVRFHFYNVCIAGSERRSTDLVTESIQINQ